MLRRSLARQLRQARLLTAALRLLGLNAAYVSKVRRCRQSETCSAAFRRASVTLRIQISASGPHQKFHALAGKSASASGPDVGEYPAVTSACDPERPTAMYGSAGSFLFLVYTATWKLIWNFYAQTAYLPLLDYRRMSPCSISSISRSESLFLP